MPSAGVGRELRSAVAAQELQVLLFGGHREHVGGVGQGEALRSVSSDLRTLFCARRHRLIASVSFSGAICSRFAPPPRR